MGYYCQDCGAPMTPQEVIDSMEEYEILICPEDQAKEEDRRDAWMGRNIG